MARMLLGVHIIYLTSSPLMEPDFPPSFPSIRSAAPDNLVYTVSSALTHVLKTDLFYAVDLLGNGWSLT